MSVATSHRARPARGLSPSDQVTPIAAPTTPPATVSAGVHKNGQLQRQDLTETQRRELFEQHVVPYMGQLYGTAVRYTRNHADAQDIVQEALAKAYAALHQYEPGTNLHAWLHRILRTTHINMIRKKQRRPAEADGGIIDDITPGVESVASAEDELLDATLSPHLKQALWDLPAGFRHVVYLADLEGCAYKEIAARMTIPLGTVMSRLHRGRQLLRHKLAAVDPAHEAARTASHAA